MDEKILALLQSMNERMEHMEQDIKDVKQDIQDVKEDVTNIKAEMSSLENHVSYVDKRLEKVENNTSPIRTTVENEIRFNIRVVAENHLNLYQNLGQTRLDVEKIKGQQEVVEVKLNELENIVKVG